MEKKIVTVSVLCFFLLGLTAGMGISIEDVFIRKVAVIVGCLIVVWLTTLNFKYIKLMKKQAEASTPAVFSLVHWLQGETWPEILGIEKVKSQFGDELAAFLETYPGCDEGIIKGYHIWRTEETEKFFEEVNPGQQQILVLMDESGQSFLVFGSEALQKAMEERSK